MMLVMSREVVQKKDGCELGFQRGSERVIEGGGEGRAQVYLSDTRAGPTTGEERTPEGVTAG